MTGEILDCRGLACPQPVVETKKKLSAMEEGVLVVLVDNETAKNNLLKLAGSLQLEAAVRAEGGSYAVSLRKEKAVPAAATGRPEGLLLTAETLGRGSEELGGLLMKSFLYALAESDLLPQTICLINSAVKLACAGSPVLESLDKLVARGVSVQACGLCLDYFGLKESLKVGEVTNMYAIVDMLAAGRLLVF